MKKAEFLVICAVGALATACSAAPADADQSPQLVPIASAAPAAEDVAKPAAPQLIPVAAEATIEEFLVSGEIVQGGWIRGTVPPSTQEAFLGGQRLQIGADGQFFAAFDRDSPSEMALRARLADGREVIDTLVVAPRKWNIEHVNVARRPGGSSEAFLRKRRPELAKIGSARNQDSPSYGWQQEFIWPVTGRISGRFGSQRVYRGEPGSYHSGIDIAPGAGTPFVAPADGVVTLAARDPFSLEGHLIIVDHGNGLNSAFLHSATISVDEGEVVKQGQRLGTVGSSGRATGPHLHWSLKWRDARLDPLLVAGPMR